jgi:hypothetical protein
MAKSPIDIAESLARLSAATIFELRHAGWRQAQRFARTREVPGLDHCGKHAHSGQDTRIEAHRSSTVILNHINIDIYALKLSLRLL